MSTGFKCTFLKCSRRRDSVNDMQKQNSSRRKNLPRHYCINPIVFVLLSYARVCVLFVGFLFFINRAERNSITSLVNQRPPGS